MSTALDDKTDLKPTDTGDHDTFAHYCKKADIERAIFEGVEIRALCGKMWLPMKDFAKYPVCPTCKDIWEKLPPLPPA